MYITVTKRTVPPLFRAPLARATLLNECDADVSGGGFDRAKRNRKGNEISESGPPGDKFKSSEYRTQHWKKRLKCWEDCGCQSRRANESSYVRAVVIAGRCKLLVIQQAQSGRRGMIHEARRVVHEKIVWKQDIDWQSTLPCCANL